MVYRGHVENGVVRLDDSPTLPEGAEVEVRLVEATAVGQEETGVSSLYQRLKPVIGIAKGLPPDASLNVDHYLYGHPGCSYKMMFTGE